VRESRHVERRARRLRRRARPFGRAGRRASPFGPAGRGAGPFGPAGLRQQVIATQPFVRSDEPSYVFRHLVERRSLTRHHVRVEVGRTPHGLTCVVDDEVEACARGQELAAERFDTRRVTKVEAEDLEAVPQSAKSGSLA